MFISLTSGPLNAGQQAACVVRHEIVKRDRVRRLHPPVAAKFWLPAPGFIDGLARMGAKYLPTVKDLKASQRFQRKQATQSKFIVTSGTPPTRKSKKK